MFSYDPWRLAQRVLEGETIQSTHTSSTGYLWLVALGGGALLTVFLITWPFIPFFWVAVYASRGATRAILTDRALYSLGGRIAYEDITGVEASSGVLKVRGGGAVYRLNGLVGSEWLAWEIQRRVGAARVSS